MSELPNDILILKFIDEKGPKGFNELDSDLKLARNTISKYLRELRTKKYIESKWDNKENKKLNYLTPEGKIALESYLGQDDKFHRLQSYYLYEELIKEIRDKFLNLYGNLPNSFLLDCIEIFLEIFKYKFTSKLPSEEFHYHLSFFLSNWDIQNSRSKEFTRILPEIMQLSQNNFCRKFKLEQTEIEYFCLQWIKLRKSFVIYDKDNRRWFLHLNSILYEALMSQIYLRTRRGTLQELVFENFTFNITNEAMLILQDAIQNVDLKLDDFQRRQLLDFISKMIAYYVSKVKGYNEIRHDLPSNPKELLNLALELEDKIAEFDEKSSRRLEIYKALRNINAKLNNYEEASIWTEKYLELNPDDRGMTSLLIMDYLYLKKYDDFLKLSAEIRNRDKYDGVIRIQLLKYYIEIKPDHDKALEILKELDNIIMEIPDLQVQFRLMEYYRVKLLIKMKKYEYALKFGEKLWYSFEVHSDEAFSLLTKIYKKLEQWETLEDFCLNAHVENKFSPLRMKNLFYSHLKRDSLNKAQYLYNWIKETYPEYLYQLEEVLNDLKIIPEKINQIKKLI